MTIKIERAAAVAGAATEQAKGTAQPVAVYKVKEAAAILKVSEKTIFNMISCGKLFSVLILGARRIPADEINRIATMGTFATPEEIERHYARVNSENITWA